MLRRIFPAVLVPLACASLVSTTPAEAAPSAAVRIAAAVTTPAGARHRCTAHDAPLRLNPIPASNDCDDTLPRPNAARSATVTPQAALLDTTLSSTPLAYSQTNGDILAIAKVAGSATDEIAIGGNFTAVITPDGVSHTANDFAVLNEMTGAVIYAGNADSYVRAIASFGGTLYVGGDFTTFGGLARNHLVSLSASFAVTGWNPAPPRRIRALAADSTGVYYGGNIGAVRKANTTTGATIWSQVISGGGVGGVLLNADNSALYVGGLFEVYGGLTQHGLIKASASSGIPTSTFNAHLRPDSGTGTHPTYDGEAGKSLVLSPDGTHLVAGIAGYGADEVKILSLTTGALFWKKTLPGDCQAVGAIESTYIVGYHRHTANGPIPYPYFAAQLAASNGALTSWDPRITGTFGNADGGNGGVQAMYVDPVRKILFLAGAFSKYQGVSSHRSLIAFSFAAA